MKYVVHSFHPTTLVVKAKTDKGVEVDGHLPGSVVELLPVDGGKTVTLELSEHNYAGVPPGEMFAVGNTVELGFRLVDEASAAAAG